MAAGGPSPLCSTGREPVLVLRLGATWICRDVDVYDPDNYVAGVPHEMFATLRREAPVYWHPTPDGDGFWSVTRHDDIVR